MRSAGRALQLLGLVLLPVGILMGESTLGSDAMAWEFGLLAFGAALFLIGWRMAGGRS